VVEWVSQFIKDKKLHEIADVLLPVPASRDRFRQPVYIIARRVGVQLGIPVDDKYITKIKETQPLKNIDDTKERKIIIQNAFNIPDTRYEGKSVLLFDDLFRSGTTLTEITQLLREKGGVQNVFVLKQKIMMSVFISGSISIRMLPPVVIETLERIMANQLEILVGDASGVDALVQKYCVHIAATRERRGDDARL